MGVGQTRFGLNDETYQTGTRLSTASSRKEPTVQTIGILHPGEMGQAVGRVLKGAGLRVVVALAGRGAESHARAESAGLEDLGTLEHLLAECDLVLSILVPSAALATGLQAATILRKTGRSLIYADCNAVSLDTTRRIGAAIAAAGSRYVDAGIVGPPPTKPGTTRFYASGAAAADLAALNAHGLDVRVAGPEIGQASLFKCCYASLTKGLIALATVQLAAAERAGLAAPLRAELESSQSALWGWMGRAVPRMPPKAQRWIAEMEEHARTFEELGLPGGMMSSAAELYRFVADAVAKEREAGSETALPDLEAVARLLAGKHGA
jgi:3-hydroxyisobutyrate dehydrogenase-like beta-hydroxyacid dehydrogenase